VEVGEGSDGVAQSRAGIEHAVDASSHIPLLKDRGEPQFGWQSANGIFVVFAFLIEIFMFLGFFFRNDFYIYCIITLYITT
jgi:hypothetical protein